MGDGVTSSSLPPCSRMNTHSLCYVALWDLPLQYIFISHWCWIWLCDLYVSGILMNVTWAEVLTVLSWFVLACWTSFICHEGLLVPAWETCGADLNGPKAWSRTTPVDLKTYSERQKCGIDIVSHWKLILLVYQNHCSKMWLIPPWHAPSVYVQLPCHSNNHSSPDMHCDSCCTVDGAPIIPCNISYVSEVGGKAWRPQCHWSETLWGHKTGPPCAAVYSS